MNSSRKNATTWIMDQRTSCFWILQLTNFLDRLAGDTYVVMLISRISGLEQQQEERYHMDHGPKKGNVPQDGIRSHRSSSLAASSQ